MSKKCICLVRVSTEQQKLEGQKEKVISAAISDGYKLEEIAVVEGKESAIKLQEEERETLNEMKNIIAQYPTIESVYVFAIDRLARKVSIILSVKDYLLSYRDNMEFQQISASTLLLVQIIPHRYTESRNGMSNPQSIL